VEKAAQLAIMIHRRPSELLELRGSKAWLLEVDYQLVMNALERMTTGKEMTDQEKAEKIKEWGENARASSHRV
jgi:hypothetical protein